MTILSSLYVALSTYCYYAKYLGGIVNVTCTMACAQSFPDKTAPSIEAKYFCFV